VLSPAALPGVPDAQAEVRRGLAEPIGMPRLSTLARSGMRIALVVDDGSRDATARVAEDHARHMPIAVQRHERNQGLGATIRDGLLANIEVANPVIFPRLYISAVLSSNSRISTISRYILRSSLSVICDFNLGMRILLIT
jgi:hypothetical protein